MKFIYQAEAARALNWANTLRCWAARASDPELETVPPDQVDSFLHDLTAAAKALEGLSEGWSKGDNKAASPHAGKPAENETYVRHPGFYWIARADGWDKGKATVAKWDGKVWWLISDECEKDDDEVICLSDQIQMP